MPGGPRSQHAAAKCSAGVLLSGGLDEDGEVLDSVLLYVPSREEFEEGRTRRMPAPRWGIRRLFKRSSETFLSVRQVIER